MRRRDIVVASGAALAVGMLDAGWPTIARAIQTLSRIVVGFPPGGSGDILARILAKKLQGAYAPAVIVENRPGAAGRIAAEFVKNAAPDGSVMLQTPASIMIIYPHVYRQMSYDLFRDFTPVTALARFQFAFSAGPGLPSHISSVAEFLGWAKANPGAASFGSPAAGAMPHFAGAMLARASGVELTHVAYKGGAPVIQALLGGEIPVSFSPVVDALPHIRNGKVRCLATTGAKRSPSLPDIPTFSEQGFKELVVEEWVGIFVPIRTPTDTVNNLYATLAAALAASEIIESMTHHALEPLGTPPGEFARAVRAEYERWASIVKATGFRADS